MNITLDLSQLPEHLFGMVDHLVVNMWPVDEQLLCLRTGLKG
jgi:hypothetical protein